MDVLNAIRSYLKKLNDKRKYWLGTTCMQDLLDFWTSVIIILFLTLIVTTLVSCNGQKIKISNPGYLVKLQCNTIDTHYMNSETVKKYIRQGINPCDCVNEYRSGCRLTGPQVVPQIPPPPWLEPKTETIFKQKTRRVI